LDSYQYRVIWLKELAIPEGDSDPTAVSFRSKTFETSVSLRERMSLQRCKIDQSFLFDPFGRKKVSRNYPITSPAEHPRLTTLSGDVAKDLVSHAVETSVAFADAALTASQQRALPFYRAFKSRWVN
jgi:hypothetical protein